MGTNKRKQYKVKPTEHITVGMSDPDRRANLLANVAKGAGKATQVGRDIKLVVGSPNIGLIEYRILNATLESATKK